MARTQKAAVIVIIDIGMSESLTSCQNSEFMKISRECASMVIQRKIFSSPKDEVGVIYMGSEYSDNSLYDGESYANISIVLPLQEPNWEGVRKLNASSGESNIHSDWLEAVAVALNYLKTESNHKKFGELRIVLFTANLKNGSPGNLSIIEDDFKSLQADLIIIYPNEIDETEVEIAKEIVEQVNGSLYDVKAALPQLMQFQKKVTKPQPWNVCLDIGSQIQIPVTGYRKINDSQKFAWKICSSSDTEGKVLVEREVTYQGQSEKVNVPQTDVVDGYKYGSTLVPFTESDKSQLGYISGPKCLSVLNVAKEELVPRHIWLGNSALIFVARKNDENAIAAFSAFVQALSQLKFVAIVRRVYNNGNRPRLGALMPCVKAKKEYLIYVEIPFSHDLRHCLLPELKPQNLKQEQLDAVDKLIDRMDLSVPIDVEGTPAEDELLERDWNGELIPHQIADPYMQHVRKCISQRILYPEKPLPDPDPGLLETMVEPPLSVKEAAADAVKEVLSLFPELESSPSSKVYGKRNAAADGADAIQSENKEPTVKKMRESKTEHIGSLNPLEDFQAAISLKNVSFLQVSENMQNVIQQLVLSSFGKEHFDKPHQCLKLLRKHILSESENKEAVSLYNNWIKDLLVKLQENLKMGFWQIIKQENLGIIHNKECSESFFTPNMANAIMGNDSADIKEEFGDDDDDMEIGELVHNL